MSSKDGRLSSSGPSSSPYDLLEHRRVLQHVGQDEKADLAAPDVDVLQLGRPAVTVRHVDGRELTVHVVLRLDQLPAVHFARVRLARNDVPLRLVQDLDGDSYGHLCDVLRTVSRAPEVKLVRIRAD